MSQSCSPIAKSNKQIAFAVLESEPGKLAYPDKSHVIFVAGDATITQSPEYEDSTEKRGTRDVADQFKKVMPAAKASLPAMLRVSELGQKPQAHDVLVSLFGSSSLENPVRFICGAALATDNTISLSSLKGRIPPAGVVRIGTESIFYMEVEENGLGTAVLKQCERGYAGTAASNIADGDAGELASIAYYQEDCNRSFTLWLQTDHIVQAVTGTTVSEAKLSLKNEGGVELSFSALQGMETLIAGTALVEAPASIGDTVIHVENAHMYDTRMKVYNADAEDDNNGLGYTIVAVDNDANTITLKDGIRAAWVEDSFVAGWLPAYDEIGRPIEGIDTEVFIDGVAGAIRSTEINYNNNINYLTDEVGTKHPRGYVEDKRSITLNMNSYFIRQYAARFKEGYEGIEVDLKVLFGKRKAIAALPRIKASMPQPSMDGATVVLDVACTALSQHKGNGNNAFYLVLN